MRPGRQDGRRGFWAALCSTCCALVALDGCATGSASFSLTGQTSEFTVSIAGEDADEPAAGPVQQRTLIWQIDGLTVRQPDSRHPDLPNRVWVRAGRHSLGVAYQMLFLASGEPSGFRAEATARGITLEAGASYTVRSYPRNNVVKLEITRDGPEPTAVWSGWANLELTSPGTAPLHMRIL